MMLNKSHLCIALTAITLSGGTLAGPEVGSAPIIESPVQTFAEPSPTVLQRSSQRTGTTLRCWQEGRLLYEGDGFVDKLSGSTSIVVPRGKGPSVTVLDLKQGLCILS